MLRPVQGTWLGITKQGRLAVLTNFREEVQVAQETQSRGAMVNAFLMQDKQKPEDTAKFAAELVEGEGVAGVGGFSLVCGKVGHPLAVISNRTSSAEGVTWIAQQRGETIGLSNTTFRDRSWPKVLDGEKMMRVAIEKSVSRGDSKEALVEELMQLLSVDTLPKRKQGEPMKSYVKELRNSILIPPIAGEGLDHVSADAIAAAKSDRLVEIQSQLDSPAHLQGLNGLYGTQKQTVVLVTWGGCVTFVERTLFDATARRAPDAERDRWFDFDLE